MSLQFCISRAVSYSETIYAYYIDDSILNNTETFSAYMATGGTYRQFKIPVGVFYYNPSTDATYLSVFAKNNFNGCLVWYDGETRREKATNAENPNAMGASFGVQKPATFGTAIPFFNNDVDASNYSMGLPYNAENWVGGKPLTPPYTWTSVPSISGKNGILQALSTLVNINDGNPISGASASAVNIIPASVVSGMIQTGASDVIVSFEIPQLTSGTYDSIKLVGKRGSIPRSKTDGEFIETLSDSDTSKTLTGLTKGYTYWFVIFAEDSKGSSSESDPYPYETGEGESVAFFEIDLGQGGKDIVRYDASKSIGSHKQGELYGNYTISNDVLNSSDNIYWGYDSTENPKNIPANCTVTFEYDAYFTNGEGYLDWYIIDSNGVEQVYWCFDTQYAFQSDKWYNCKTVCKVENGIIKRYKFVLDDIEISCGTGDKKMPCTDTENSVGVQNIHFRLTRPTKMKNISIYYDFSQYTDGGGGGGGSGASGSNSLS